MKIKLTIVICCIPVLWSRFSDEDLTSFGIFLSCSCNRWAFIWFRSSCRVLQPHQSFTIIFPLWKLSLVISWTKSQMEERLCFIVHFRCSLWSNWRRIDGEELLRSRMDLGILGVYGRWLEVNWVWSEWLIIYNAIFSIVIPITLVELSYPNRRNERWLNDKKLAGTGCFTACNNSVRKCLSDNIPSSNTTVHFISRVSRRSFSFSLEDSSCNR